MKCLYVGDPHVTVSNLKESERLLSFIFDTASSNKVDKVVFLGDQTHNHAVIRSEVLAFWMHWLEQFGSKFRTIVLVGNHDMVGDHAETAHSMLPFKLFNKDKKSLLSIVDEPLVENNIVYVPYIHDKVKFVEMVNSLSDQANTLVCHADWDGAQYENGFYAPNGIKQEDVNFKLIITGHIHKRARFGKIILPGTARWLTASDANEPKGLWLVGHADDGSIVSESFIDTSEVCTPILSFTWKEGEEAPIIPDGARVTVELIGSSSWITKKKATLKGKASISSKCTDQKRKIERKAGNSLEKYLLELYETKTNKNKLLDFAKELGIV